MDADRAEMTTEAEEVLRGKWLHGNDRVGRLWGGILLHHNSCGHLANSSTAFSKRTELKKS